MAPSTTRIDGTLAIRAAIFNHRTNQRDVDLLVDNTIRLGRRISCEMCEGDPGRGHLERGNTPVERCDVLSRFQRARCFEEEGRMLEARSEYIKLLEAEPSHLGALNNLGNLLFATGFRSAARIAYSEAVKQHPNDAMSRVNLGNLLFECSERSAARMHYEHALRIDPTLEKAHEGLSYVLADLGDAERAAWHRRKAFENRFVIPMPYRGNGAGIPLLQLVSTIGGNVRTQRFLDNRIFRTFVVIPEFYDERVPLPAHRIVFNAIGDADAAPEALAAAERWLRLTGAPVVNSPSAVRSTSRVINARRLAGVSGVVAPKTVTLPRSALEDRDATTTLAQLGFSFPILIRTPGSHTGEHFVRVERMEALRGALSQLPGKELILIQYLDAAGRDGKTRKCRVMTVGRELLPLHLAVGHDWKVHYFTADMADSPEHRDEDARFLADMTGVLGPRAMNALRQIQAIQALDYGGIDFGLNQNGDVLFFEANATMVVVPPGADERWAYRRSPVERVFAAVQNMLIERAFAAPAPGGVPCELHNREMSQEDSR